MHVRKVSESAAGHGVLKQTIWEADMHCALVLLHSPMRGKDVVAVLTAPVSTKKSKKSSPGAGAPGLLGFNGTPKPSSSPSVLLMLSILPDLKDQPKSE